MFLIRESRVGSSHGAAVASGRSGESKASRKTESDGVAASEVEALSFSCLGLGVFLVFLVEKRRMR